jgi:hypothetical protein
MQLQYQYSNIISHVLCRTTVSFTNEKDSRRVLIVLVQSNDRFHSCILSLQERTLNGLE